MRELLTHLATAPLADRLIDWYVLVIIPVLFTILLMMRKS
jgi:hypothetical protein